MLGSSSRAVSGVPSISLRDVVGHLVLAVVEPCLLLPPDGVQASVVDVPSALFVIVATSPEGFVLRVMIEPSSQR